MHVCQFARGAVWHVNEVGWREAVTGGVSDEGGGSTFVAVAADRVDLDDLFDLVREIAFEHVPHLVVE